MPAHPLQHRCHDYKLLVQRWKALARQAGLRMWAFAQAGEWPVFCLESPVKPGPGEVWHYLSAGVHGDEAAPPWGLLEWAEGNAARLRSEPFLIFPALNPSGLILNTRVDHRGVDINRSFHSAEDPLIVAWRAVVGDRRLGLCLCLHEDYDAQGCYVYELTHRGPGIGRDILQKTERVIPTDRRGRIDGRAAKDGLIIRRVPPELPGQPEAIVLHSLRAPVTLTFESPSEFCLTDRIAVQKLFIELALRHRHALGQAGAVPAGLTPRKLRRRLPENCETQAGS